MFFKVLLQNTQIYLYYYTIFTHIYRHLSIYMKRICQATEGEGRPSQIQRNSAVERYLSKSNKEAEEVPYSQSMEDRGRPKTAARW